MKALIVIPSIHKETTEECLKNIDKKFHQDIMLIDNSADKMTAHNYRVGFRENPSVNIGVGRAWNLGVKKVLQRKYDFLIILSASIRFSDGMIGFMKELQKHSNANGLMTQEGWHCIALHRRVFEQVGDFDTNFYPAYYEDSDFIRRMELAKIHEPCGGTVTLPGCEISATSFQIAHGMKKGKVFVNMGACAEYFIRKWGNYPKYDSKESRDALYSHPFNDPAFDLKYYPEHTIEELKILYKLT